MKQIPFLCSLALLCVPLTACAQSESSVPADRQINVFSKFVSIWQVDAEEDWWAYAVTDLDRDGTLELLSTESHGTGHFTTSSVWRADLTNEKQKVLCAAASDAPEYMGPRFEPHYDEEGGTAPVPVYYDQKDNAYHYILKSLVKDGMLHYYESENVMTMKDGEITTELIGSREIDCSEEGEETITYRDSGGNAITEEAYENAAAEHFADCIPMEANIFWIETTSFQSIGSEAERAELLTNSYEHFSLTEIP